MYSVRKKEPEYRYPMYRSTGTPFKRLFLSIVFNILKKSYFLNIQPVHLGFVCDLLYGTTYSEYAKFWSAPPLYLEDEDIFQKSAPLVQILQQFPIVPTEPIFELHL